MNNTYKLVFLEEANEDYADAFVWYANIQEDLGMSFENEIENLLLRIIEFPNHFPTIYKGVHKGLVKRFPYVIFFKVYDTEIIIVAIVHTSQNPKRLEKRVDDSL